MTATQISAPGIPDQRDQITRLFAGLSGWACLSTCDGDPQIEDLKEHWYKWPQQRSALIADAALYSSLGFNVYIRQCLFTRRKASYTTAVASPWLWLDDVALTTPATDIIQTSAGKYQALVRLDRALEVGDRKRLMVAWRDATPGADNCSSNAVQPIRLVGGRNRKNHGDWTVRYAAQSERTYPADRLLARCAELQPECEAPDLAELDSEFWQEVAAIRGNMHWVDDPVTGLPRRMKSTATHGYQILNGEHVVFTLKNGKKDDSPSMYRCSVAYHMRQVGYEDDEVAAKLTSVKRLWTGNESTEQVQTKVQSAIAYAHQHAPNAKTSPSFLRVRAQQTNQEHPAAPLPQVDRARRGKPIADPHVQTLARLIAEAGESGRLIQRRKETAAALGLTLPTFDRHIRKLKDMGAINVEVSATRAYSVIVIQEAFLGAITNSGQPAETALIAAAHAVESVLSLPTFTALQSEFDLPIERTHRALFTESARGTPAPVSCGPVDGQAIEAAIGAHFAAVFAEPRPRPRDDGQGTFMGRQQRVKASYPRVRHGPLPTPTPASYCPPGRVEEVALPSFGPPARLAEERALCSPKPTPAGAPAPDVAGKLIARLKQAARDQAAAAGGD